MLPLMTAVEFFGVYEEASTFKSMVSALSFVQSDRVQLKFSMSSALT